MKHQVLDSSYSYSGILSQIVLAFLSQFCTSLPNSMFSDVFLVAWICSDGCVYTRETGKHYKSQILPPLSSPWRTGTRAHHCAILHRAGCNWEGYIRGLSIICNAFMLSRISKAETSLVAQWLRIRLPMQGICVRSLVREDPTWCAATKTVHHNYWACALEPVSHNYWAHVPQLLKPARCAYSPCSATSEAAAKRSPHTTRKSSPCSPQLEKAHAQQRRPKAAINK